MPHSSLRIVTTEGDSVGSNNSLGFATATTVENPLGRSVHPGRNFDPLSPTGSTYSRSSQYPLPNFMFMKNTTGSDLGALGGSCSSVRQMPIFLSEEELNLNNRATANTGRTGTPRATPTPSVAGTGRGKHALNEFQLAFVDYQDRLRSIQARYPTINITGEVSNTATRSQAGGSVTSSRWGPVPPVEDSDAPYHHQHHVIPDAIMNDANNNNNPSHHNHLHHTDAKLRRCLGRLTPEGRLDLLVDLVTAARSLANSNPAEMMSRESLLAMGRTRGEPLSILGTPRLGVPNRGDVSSESHEMGSVSPPPKLNTLNLSATRYMSTPGRGGCDEKSQSTCTLSPLNSSVASLEASVPVFESRELTQTFDPEGNEMVNNYSLIGELGSGSFAKVHLAEHNTTQELVAVKIIKKSLRRTFARNAGAAQQVATEIALLKKVNHRNIIKLHGVIDDPDDDKVVMIMQYASGGPLLLSRKEVSSPLGSLIEREEDEDGSIGYLPITAELAANYTRQVSTGLHYLHRHDILHRDIKPENLLLESLDSNRVLIGDLGVGAMFSDSSALKKTAGTPAFFSPELCRGEVHLHGKASDIWALGVTTYAMVFGDLPFKARLGDNLGGLSGLLHAIQNDPLVIPESADGDLKDFLHHILDKDPLRRMTLAQLRHHPWILLHNEHELTWRGDQDRPVVVSSSSEEVAPSTAIHRAAGDQQRSPSGFTATSTRGNRLTPVTPAGSGSAGGGGVSSGGGSGGGVSTGGGFPVDDEDHHGDDVSLTLTMEEVQNAVYRVPSMRMAVKLPNLPKPPSAQPTPRGKTPSPHRFISSPKIQE